MAPKGRTSIKGKARKAKKYVREQYTYEHRLATINYLARTGDMRATIDRFLKNPSGDEREAARVLIQGWKANRATIESACQNPKTARSFRLRPKGKGIVLSAFSELRLVSWINDLRRDGVPVCSALLRGRALEIATEQGIPSGQFRASKSWIGGFLQRHRLSFRARTHHGQQTPADAERTAREFALEVRAEVEEKRIVNVVNADQTGVNFELVL